MTVIHQVHVSLDDKYFNAAFIGDYRANFFSYSTIEEHAQHLALNAVCGNIHHEYLEGYGEFSAMGIKIRIEHPESSIE